MKILALTKNLPYPLDGGSKIRNYYLLKHLAAHHEIFLVSVVRSEAERGGTDRLLEFCRGVECVELPRTFAVKVRDVLRSTVGPYPYTAAAHTCAEIAGRVAGVCREYRPDVILCHELFMAGNVRELPVRFVLDAHNAETQILDRLAASQQSALMRVVYRRQASLMRRLEDAVAAEAACVFAVSEPDVEYFRSRARKAVLIPNGVPKVARRELTVAPRVLFTGDFKYPPNSRGFEWFLREVWPAVRAELPAARLEVVARQPGREVMQESGESVTFHREVDDIVPFFRRARAVVAPLFVGGGTRLKVLQACAEGAAVVATRIGAEGLGFQNEQEVLLADTAPEFARALIRVLSDDALAKRLIAHAADVVEARFQWKVSADRLSDELNSVVP